MSTNPPVETAQDRLRIVMGDAALEKLAHARVCVLGLGGVGSNCAHALARGGVGNLVLLDRDTVAPSNINRQAVALHSTIGRPKTEVIAEQLKDINPDIKLELYQQFLEKDKAFDLLDSFGPLDYVVDAIDTISQKLVIAAWAQERGVRLISSMGGANKLNPERLRIAKIEDTISCPLSRVMRKECKKRGIKGLEVLYSSEVPIKTDAQKASQPGKRPEKGLVLGTMSYIPPIMGMMIAGHVIQKIAELENPEDSFDRALSEAKRRSRSKR